MTDDKQDAVRLVLRAIAIFEPVPWGALRRVLEQRGRAPRQRLVWEMRRAGLVEVDDPRGFAWVRLTEHGRRTLRRAA